MYEDFEENIATVGENSGEYPDIPGDVSGPAGSFPASVSSGDAGADAGSNSGFDYDRFAESLSAVMGGSVSGSDSAGTVSTVQEDILENLQTLNTSVQALSAVVSLIFAFLLLDWTSRKLLAVVNHFTGRRK